MTELRGGPAFLIVLVGLLAGCGAVSLLGQMDRSDPRFSLCAGNAAPVLAAFPIAQAGDFWAHFPKAGRVPELQGSTTPAFVVVFEGRWSGAVNYAPPAAGQTFAVPTLTPGSHDLCLWEGDAASGQLNVYADVDTTGMTP